MSEERIKQVHFIGVGGVGMSGIARVAHDQGMQVSGSDIKESRYTKQLREAGITVFIGQKAENIPEGDPVVVISTAILENNPELIEARRRGLEIWHRAQMLAHLGVGLDTLAVAGTHGKTTTSSMLASALDALGADPTFLIGGIVRAYGTNAHSGTGDHYVVEADESDKSFTYLSPKAVLVTNIEADHLDHYADLDDIYENFRAFIASVPDDGVAVVCGDDAALAERMGVEVRLTEGDVENIKLTTPEDMLLARQVILRREGQKEEKPMVRIGHGYDVHRLTEERKLILCGVEIPYTLGLLGHSDADVALHALMDALLGAAALGDIGRHFPDTDPAYKGADSGKLLDHVVALLEEKGYVVGNVDVTIICQRPKLKDYIEQMRQNVARHLKVDADCVNIKATTTEKLGFEGEGQGISSHAVACMGKA